MDLKLHGRRALVTGASKGIGLAIARMFAAEGCHVQIVARTEADLEEAAAAIRADFNVDADYHVADLSDSGQVKSVAEPAARSTFSSTVPARSRAARCSRSTKSAGARPGT